MCPWRLSTREVTVPRGIPVISAPSSPTTLAGMKGIRTRGTFETGTVSVEGQETGIWKDVGAADIEVSIQGFSADRRAQDAYHVRCGDRLDVPGHPPGNRDYRETVDQGPDKFEGGAAASDDDGRTHGDGGHETASENLLYFQPGFEMVR